MRVKRTKESINILCVSQNGTKSGLRFTNGGGYTCIAADNRSIPVLSEILY